MAYTPFDLGTGTTDGESATGFADDTSPVTGTDASFLGNGGSDGSPGGSGGGDDFTYDPERHAGPDKRNADGSYRKKRGRKPGGNSATTRSRSKADHQASLEGLTRILSIIHIGVATATKTPEMALEEEEAKTLAAATATVLQEFDIRPDPKVEAIVGLITAAGMIYGPRAYLISERKKEEKKRKQAA